MASEHQGDTVEARLSAIEAQLSLIAEQLAVLRANVDELIGRCGEHGNE